MGSFRRLVSVAFVSSVAAAFGAACGASDDSRSVSRDAGTAPDSSTRGNGSGNGGLSQGNGGRSGGSANAGGSSTNVGGAGGSGASNGSGGARDASLGDGGADAASPVADAGCTADAMPVCLGVCAATPPTCVGGTYRCTGPGFEAVEHTCDGFDNDCDGVIDEGCPSCSIDLARINANLDSKWDIDFDAQCNAYLTTIKSGPDSTTVVPADSQASVATYQGNANQNMGFGLVDPDPSNHRVVVNYACCEACGCLAQNGVTLLYTCDPEGGCGCTGQTNCPGFLDQPFFATATKDTSATVAGYRIATPTGLAAGPGSTYFVGNFEPKGCSAAASCTPCDPAHPDVWCSAAKPACCQASGNLGRVARFTAPTPATAAEFRIVATLPGEEVLGLAPSGDGSVLIGTYAGATTGNLYRLLPGGSLAKLATLAGPVYSVTEDRASTDVYVEILGTPKIHRFSAGGTVLTLPVGVPASPADDGILQSGPDGKLYRLVGVVNGPSTLSGYAVR